MRPPPGPDSILGITTWKGPVDILISARAERRPRAEQTVAGTIAIVEEWHVDEWHMVAPRNEPWDYGPKKVDGIPTWDYIAVLRRDFMPRSRYALIGTARSFLGVLSVGWWDSKRGTSPATLIFVSGFPMGAAIVLLAAPSEWRRARVRTVHALRIASWSLAPIPILLALRCLSWIWTAVGWEINWRLAPVGRWSPSIRTPSLPERIILGQHEAVTMLLLAVWLPVFWWCALHHGVKLSRPFFLWLFVSIAGLAAGLLALTLLPAQSWESIA